MCSSDLAILDAGANAAKQKAITLGRNLSPYAIDMRDYGKYVVEVIKTGTRELNTAAGRIIRID